jgi:hypothetical protein
MEPVLFDHAGPGRPGAYAVLGDVKAQVQLGVSDEVGRVLRGVQRVVGPGPGREAERWAGGLVSVHISAPPSAEVQPIRESSVPSASVCSILSSDSTDPGQISSTRTRTSAPLRSAS